MYKLKPLKTEKDYEDALAQIDKLWNAKPNSPEEDMLDILVTLIEKYEDKHFPIDPPDPIEAIKFMIEQRGINRAQLDKILGGRNRTSEILNKKRKLSLNMMRKLHNDLRIPYHLLLTDYERVKDDQAAY
jgi:HTH-type transcriptional regulator/antitoxin HigA